MVEKIRLARAACCADGELQVATEHMRCTGDPRPGTTEHRLRRHDCRNSAERRTGTDSRLTARGWPRSSPGSGRGWTSVRSPGSPRSATSTSGSRTPAPMARAPHPRGREPAGRRRHRRPRDGRRGRQGRQGPGGPQHRAAAPAAARPVGERAAGTGPDDGGAGPREPVRAGGGRGEGGCLRAARRAIPPGVRLRARCPAPCVGAGRRPAPGAGLQPLAGRAEAGGLGGTGGRELGPGSLGRVNSSGQLAVICPEYRL